MIAMATPGEMLADRSVLACVGRPPAVHELSIRDGELYVRTPAQACAYWGDEDETADVFRDGWVRTRDLAHLDERGYCVRCSPEPVGLRHARHRAEHACGQGVGEPATGRTRR